MIRDGVSRLFGLNMVGSTLQPIRIDSGMRCQVEELKAATLGQRKPQSPARAAELISSITRTKPQATVRNAKPRRGGPQPF